MSAPSDHPLSASGRFSDGKTAGASDADVRLGATGIEIRTARGTALDWSYASLTSAEPITPHAIDALINSTVSHGATLFVPDAAFVRELGKRAPHLTARAIRWRHAKPWIAAASVVAFAAALAWVLDISPARTIAGLLPERARAALGREVARSMGGGRPNCSDSEGQAALDRLNERLAKATGGRAFKVVVVNWPLLNAFAAPGEQIILTRALITKAESPDEVAGVLAHEMGHGIELDPETGLVRALGMTAAAELMMGGSSGTLGNVGILLAQLSYTRAAEHRADLHALEILKEAGISPDGFAAFFRRVTKIEAEEGKPASSITILSTHPLTEERQELVDHAPRYPATPAMPPKDWAALQAICKGVDASRQ